MPEDERCPLNPTMLKAYCSHCQGTGRGTSDNPRFSIKEYTFQGQPIVEVLKDGGQVVQSDKHFRFGVRKAQMLVACAPLLKEFWQSSDETRRQFKTQLVEIQRQRLRIDISVEMQPDFERSSDGLPVDRPFLRLQALPPDNDHIGLGAMKCRAICAVENDLRQWLRKHDVLF